LKVPNGLPEDPALIDLSSEDQLRELYRVLLDIHIVEGCLMCPKCERKYPIIQSIPNMLLREDEV
jgi:multifunctional methyltransferase subunit TRM112